MKNKIKEAVYLLYLYKGCNIRIFKSHSIFIVTLLFILCSITLFQTQYYFILI